MPGRSLKLAAFVAQNGPLDRFVRLRRTAPHPTAAEELVTMRTKSYSKTAD